MPNSPPASARPIPPDEHQDGYRYGNLYAPALTPPELAELRRQQDEFARTARQIDIQNSWMAVPSLAPIAAVLGAEAAGAVAARFFSKGIPPGPLALSQRDPYLRVGDNWATRAGRRAHRFYEEMANAKPGWDYEPKVPGPNGRPLKPDLGAPPRTADPNVRKYIEIKPNTPSGRAAAARQIRKYEEATEQKVRALFYDLKRFI